ncbi:MAG: YicC family protein [Eubacterium sp.]|nr:YicC family protein [Eubacterium sp.]MCH4046395.1 YicC family protein [Eubacterium sp.]MCH4079490.1 YicC family protein [Eubacterium sp.]MCH4111092.1 YicC family protein [Eubacterium sp.]MCI1307919.1 YicC family protein [Eubacterium sp.]
MIRSMTGFGRGEYRDEERSVTAEIRSVNHRYCDVAVKLPYAYSFAEDPVRKAVKKHIRRGKADCRITIDLLKDSDVKISLNRPVLDQYMDSLRKMKSEYNLEGDLSIALAASLPDVFKEEPSVADEEAIVKACEAAAEQAAENLSSMRLIEGEKLAKDLLMRADLVKGYVESIETRSEHVPEEYRDKLQERIKDLLSDSSVEVPEDRLAVEVAMFADKANITEELIRLKSHLDQMKAIISSDEEADGKKLDFLVQEMNREANTIGSKANDLEITRLVLKCKAEIEKIREQVQNIE